MRAGARSGELEKPYVRIMRQSLFTSELKPEKIKKRNEHRPFQQQQRQLLPQRNHQRQQPCHQQVHLLRLQNTKLVVTAIMISPLPTLP